MVYVYDTDVYDNLILSNNKDPNNVSSVFDSVVDYFLIDSHSAFNLFLKLPLQYDNWVGKLHSLLAFI